MRVASLNRSILHLAVPALGALIAEPLFLLTDTAMVGHLGVAELAGLGLAGAVLQTLIGLMVFLAYATTPAVARRIGAGDPRGAVSVGIDGLWLALGLGVVIGALGVLLTPWVIAQFGAQGAASAAAEQYLAVSMAGIPAMLLVFAATGLLRGLQDTITPLWVAGIGFALNAGLNFVLIYPAGLGIAGSALGTVIAQWLMVLAYLLVIARHARRVGARVRPSLAGVRGSARAGGWLLLRTASLRAAMLFAIATAAALGDPELAGFQIVMTLFSTLAFALDALAIAAQALVGRGLGAGDVAFVRRVLRRCVQWGIGSGLVLGLPVALASGVIGRAFTTDPALAAMISPSLVVLAIGAPLAGVVFVLDGVLIGAGDARYLALTGVVNLACFLAILAGTRLLGVSGPEGLTWLTGAFTIGYIAARAVTLGLRARGERWMRTGVVPA
ncbi:MATE family efflux transporter [Mycetocola tolaasinivorans]|uniref:MATE family efflux transporter n=1 Tax=Mycetocola tolaasinivorans TaxID=76635 RepID=A0A3L6ZY29_9MICO|nr:MATE family efflux transporter [Mycetocola tolaasinivorans]RLP72680.1 MATE family efflux transporter [Mycetocola tolaasinivorans]